MKISANSPLGWAGVAIGTAGIALFFLGVNSLAAWCLFAVGFALLLSSRFTGLLPMGQSVNMDELRDIAAEHSIGPTTPEDPDR